MKKEARKSGKSDQAKTVAKAVLEKPRPAYWARWEGFLNRYAVSLAIGFVVLATLRIVIAYSTFSHTFDEPAHIACGMEYLEKHAYTYEPQHPPLTRSMTALLPKIFGSHGHHQKSMWDEGLAILFDSGTEDRTLTLARLGTLPFFWITCWITFLCTVWISESRGAAVLAVFLLTMTPTVLAHAGLATTDMGLTAMLLASIYTGWRWIEEPTWRRAGLFGATTGLAVLAKFSTFAFFPSIWIVALLIWLYFDRPPVKSLATLSLQRAPQLLGAAAIAVVLIWAGYFFSFGKPAGWSFALPAPEFFTGIQDVQHHNATGHLTYLLGAANTVGWWYFYIVALAVKTPLPVLFLGLGGLVLMFSRKLYGTRGWILPSTVLGILIFSSFFTQIKIGTRHVLPVFAALAMAGACATTWALRRLEGRAIGQAAVALTVLSVAAVSLFAHPDYLAYFNFIAGDKPEAFLVDSDLDWAQDVKRLAKKLKEVGAAEVYYNQFAPGDLPKFYGFPPIHPLDFNGPQPGWNAVNLTPLKYGLFGDNRYVHDPGFQFWTDQLTPEARVGRGILLFYRPK